MESPAAPVVAAVRLAQHPDPALWLLAVASSALMFIGIHNVWDAITWVAAGNGGSREEA